jgi:hypothetical protein
MMITLITRESLWISSPQPPKWDEDPDTWLFVEVFKAVLAAEILRFFQSF